MIRAGTRERHHVIDSLHACHLRFKTNVHVYNNHQQRSVLRSLSSPRNRPREQQKNERDLWYAV